MLGADTERIWWYPKNIWWRTLVSILAITATNMAGYYLFYDPCPHLFPEIEWQTYYPSEVKASLKSGRPALVFIDVDWDPTNQFVEESINHSNVRDLLCQYDVATFRDVDIGGGPITLADDTKERIDGWYIHLYPASGDLKPVKFFWGNAQEIEDTLENR